MTRTVTLAALPLLIAVSAHAQTPDGAAVFTQSCASCHTGAVESRAPAPEALRARSPQSIVESLVNGAMRTQGARLSGALRRAVAEYLTGKTIAGDVRGTDSGRCGIADQLPAARARLPRWAGWSPAATNTRVQTAADAGLVAADVPRLSLKWSFGFPDASVAWSQPTVAGGRVLVGSQNGTVYALDAGSGCIRWTYAARGGVRTAVVVGPAAGSAPSVAYFGDTAANIYGLDAETGRELWVRKVDEHPLARITASPTLHEGRVYVGMSSYEESQGADPQYGCCTFRGSVSALDAATGAVVWKTALISDPLQRRGTSTAGVPLWGPSGSAVWSAPTIDAARLRLYVATGNAYSGPPVSSSNAVVALDLADGAVKWTRQVTPGDVYVSNCRSGNPNCPEVNGPDVDFGSPPMLTRAASGRDLLVIGQKSGVGYALDPEKDGAIVWQYRAGRGGLLGGIEWGSAVDAERAYFAVSDVTTPQPGGLHAVALATGAMVWTAPPPPLTCAAGRGCLAAQSAALTVIPGVVFSGSFDGALRAYSTATGEVIWSFDTNRTFTAVNGVAATGASIGGPGPAVAGGMVFVNSGYGAFLGRPGNVLLAFGVEEKR
ncbi:MAG TPA: PQQ-binding-like beta-propeller repeat protein [Vicinamibacterales bacterium]|jgi:polyvinyl alcohol dehydrogenase (cytochrome)|nr:PQQ-binding-like beta-propeller repeat protein [Vicinamibacterales bacterium]